ncbi:MAG: hypothetical protein JHC39_04725 [Lentimicrobium sp.]|nr:hypothetical protein [Lentimicrobium sp.]
MKTFNFTLALVILVTLSGCKAIDSLTHFTIPFNTNVTIKSNLNIGSLPFIPTPPIPLETDQTFKSNNTAKELIEKAYIKTLKLTVLKPDGEDFSILKNIEIYIAADGLDDVKVASLDLVPTGKSSIDLNCSNADLKPFIMKDKFTLKIKTVTDEINTKDYDIQIDGSFWLDAKILGV